MLLGNKIGEFVNPVEEFEIVLVWELLTCRDRRDLAGLSEGT